MSEEKLNQLHNAIVGAVISIPETDVKDESGMLNLFPKDLMTYGLGTEISIEITKVPLLCDHKIRNKLAKAVGRAVKKLFPEARVECEALPINPYAGFWFAISEAEQFKQECAEGLHE
ncbi:MAG: hypothetical protein V1867_00680 [Candidatus Falkowbacteria bacterium]